MAKTAAAPPCPCGSAISYDQCCGRLIDHGLAAADAEALMRSRYTAYTRLAARYLLATWHPSTRPPDLAFEPPLPQWIGLTVKARGQSAPDLAWVEFVARYKIGGRAHRLEEHSRFRHEDGRWYYLDGNTGAPG
jgi:SEC-C motif-containing protein